MLLGVKSDSYRRIGSHFHPRRRQHRPRRAKMVTSDDRKLGTVLYCYNCQAAQTQATI
jgi:hypothetical protein